MPNIRKPMSIPELNLKPPIDGTVRLSEDMQQTLALLTAMGVTGRKLMKCSESGVLYTGSAKVKGVWNKTGSGADDDVQGDNANCTECVVMANPDNAGRLWVKPYKVADEDDGVPLDAGDAVNFTVTNLSQIHVNVIADGDKVIVIYSI